MTIPEIIKEFREKFTFTDHGEIFMLSHIFDEDQIETAKNIESFLKSKLSDFEKAIREETLKEAQKVCPRHHEALQLRCTSCLTELAERE